VNDDCHFKAKRGVVLIAPGNMSRFGA